MSEVTENVLVWIQCSEVYMFHNNNFLTQCINVANGLHLVQNIVNIVYKIKSQDKKGHQFDIIWF